MLSPEIIVPQRHPNACSVCTSIYSCWRPLLLNGRLLRCLLLPCGHCLLYAFGRARLLRGALYGLVRHDNVVEFVLRDDVDGVCV